MRAKIASNPDGDYKGRSVVDSDGVVDEPLEINLTIRKRGDTLEFDLSESSKPCRGPMNSVIATTKSAIYLAVKHILPEVPINAGTFEPLITPVPVVTFLDAQYPRPVSGWRPKSVNASQKPYSLRLQKLFQIGCSLHQPAQAATWRLAGRIQRLATIT